MRSLTKRSKPVVAHVHTTFFIRSETFIYQYTSRHKRFRPIYAASAFENLAQFPVRPKDLFKTECARFSYAWLLEKLYGPHVHLTRVIRRNRARLIHAHFGINGVSAMPVVNRMGIPLITTFYGFDLSKLSRKEYWRSRYKLLFQHGRLFLVEGQHMKSALAALGCPEEKITIQRIAIPIDQITYKVRTAKSSRDKVIFVFSGRFVEKKGLLQALQAFDRVRARRSNFEFRIIGDGILKEAIEKFIETNRMAGCTKLLGFLTYDEYLDQMSQADVFIHPSITADDGDSEGGAPTTILEAQAMGMPVISTRHADIPNVVAPGKSALLCEERDVGQLAENIAAMLEDRDAWKDMGAAGREFVETYHDVKKEIDRLEEHYDSVLC